MWKALISSKNGAALETHDPLQVRAALQDPQSLLWIDVEEASPEEIKMIQETFNFHPLAMEDVVQNINIPKLSVYDNYAFLALHRLFYDFEKEDCERREYEAFFSDKFLVTFHDKNLSRTFAAAWEKAKENPKKMLAMGPSLSLLKILEFMSRDYLPVIEEWQDNLEIIEQQVLKGSKDHILDHILKFKKLVANMRKSLMPERDVIRQLYESPSMGFLPDKVRVYFKSAVDDTNALFHELENLRDHASSVFDVYAAVLTIQMTEASNKLNYVMQRLTIAATIFLPLTFLVGVYGMNFEYMPELRWPGFYYILWGLMLFIAVSMIMFFKRKKWL